MFDYFRGLFTRWFGRTALMLAAAQFEWNQSARNAFYGLRELLFNNTVYRPQQQGGMLELILREELGRHVDIRRFRILGFFNPIRQIIEAYSGIYPGEFGKDVCIADDYNGEPIDENLQDYIGQIWRQSNLDTTKANLLEWGPNLGTVGIRISAQDDPDPLRRRILITFDHPSRITDYDEDDQGNVTRVLLRYKMKLRKDLGDTNPRDVDVEELWTKDKFSRKYNGVEQLSAEQQVNALGFCPYIILQHRNRGARWGEHAYAGSETIIHSINHLIARQDKSVDRHIFPKWFVAAGGQPPKNVDVGEESVAYCKMNPESPTPIFSPLVAALNQSDTMAFWDAIIELMREKQPEMLINYVKLISGVSGETLARVLQPAEKRIKDARAAYDHAMKRALQIGLSWGIVLGMWDLGTGTGTADAADRAFLQGLENFDFDDRPVLPQTVYDKLNDQKLDTVARTQGIADAVALKDDLSHKERLRMAGFSDEQIATIDEERAQDDVIPTQNPDDLGGDGAGGGTKG